MSPVLRRLGVLVLVLVLAAVGLAPTAGAQAPVPSPAARIGVVEITQERFDHWMRIVGTMEGRDKTELVPPRMSIPWKRMRSQVMQFLITAEWILGEAQRQGIVISDERVEANFQRSRKKSFPTPRAWRRFLRRTGQTIDDVRWRFRLDMTSTRVASSVDYQDFHDRWKTQTACGEDYWIRGYCGNPLER